MQQEELQETEISPPEEFSFPFQPYQIQTEFMKDLFSALEKKKLGIFESPTGTGKSLSLLCGALTWMENHEGQRLMDLRKFISDFDLEREEKEAATCQNWISAQHELRKKKDILFKCKRELEFLEGQISRRNKALEGRKKKTVMDVTLLMNKRQEKKSDKKVDEQEDDVDFMLDDYAINNYSDSDVSDSEEVQEPEFAPVKIVFASRTHSQLSQFINELKRTSFGKKVTATTLGSRQGLCINPDVLKLKNLSLINERCLDLQKGSKGVKTNENKKQKKCSGCPYFKHSAVEDLKNRILAEPVDIEELVGIAKNESKACPYYATRKAAKEAQLILMPYNTILHAGTRQGVGISTRNAVLILDEAHNIIESISNMYSHHISLSQLKDCLAGLETYIKRYISRFNSKNLLHLKQMKFILKTLAHFLESEPKEDSKNLYRVQEFKFEIGMENLDLFSLVKFCEKYRLIFKLKGYMIQQQRLALRENESDPQSKTSIKGNRGNQGLGKEKAITWNSQSVLNFSEFLKSLQTMDNEGRVIVDRKTKDYKFLLLNVAQHFRDLIFSARSIILAGGTMKPYDEITDQLFTGLSERITHFSCDHVIPKDNLVCLTLTKGPTATAFDFTFKNRNSPGLLDELAKTIMNTIRVVPGGVVCFLPSYDYEATLYKYLVESGMFKKLEEKKKIFREPKDGSCDAVLAEYSRQVRNSNKGAMLFAVVGGKLSEGINFSDALGRCVLVVGLPYPNITSVEIQEKVRYASATFGKEKGDSLLPNMCSKAVNQSVGRAIRHATDYAAIVLVDQRFSSQAQQSLLPNWIRDRSQICNSFGQYVGSLAKFFAAKKVVPTICN